LYAVGCHSGGSRAGDAGGVSCALVVHNGVEWSSRGELGGVAGGIGVIGTGRAGLVLPQLSCS
jgi:hypothetical protein